MSSNDKAYKLSLDVFSKLRNDHELFLDAYESIDDPEQLFQRKERYISYFVLEPTQIYRFLKACHALKPLFLHRNLSYLKHRNSRRGQKRQRRLKIDDLINHTRSEKHDLASEIKSGNYLDITMRGLMDGIDFKKMLDDSCPATSTNPETYRNGQLMEVEVLLYHFTQPSAQMSHSHNSYPCSCITLGKCIVEYNSTADSTTSGSEKPASSKEKVVLSSSFAIPESALSWKGRYGMQLVVFRVTPYNGEEKAEPKKGMSTKTPRKSLSNVSLSRLAVMNDTIASPQASKLKEPTSKERQVGADTVTRQPARVLDGEEGANGVLGTSQSCRSNKATRSCRQDACIMTDISYGTQVIAEQLGAQMSAPSFPPSQSCCGSLSSRRGYSEKCTSPLLKLLPRNGVTKNGVSLVEGNPSKIQRGAPAAGPSRDNTHTKHETNGRDGTVLVKEANGVAKEEPPLVIRVPRRYVQVSGSDDSQSEIDIENDDSDDGGGEWEKREGGGGGGRLPRRSEVQLLIDGDKPPEERVRASDIPVISAEEVRNNRSARRSTSDKVPSRLHHLSGGTQRAVIDPAPCPTMTSPQRKGYKRSLSSETDIFSQLPPQSQAKRSRTDSESRDDPLPPQSDAADCSSLDEDFVDCPEEPMVEQPPPPEPSQPQTSQDVYVAELAMFDSRGVCLLEDGEYDVLMQRCLQGNGEEEVGATRPGLFTFAPLSWDTVFGGSTKESVMEDSGVSNTMLLKVTFHWRHGPPPHRLANDLDTALDIRKLREAYAFKPSGPTVVTPAEQQPTCNSIAVQDKTDLTNCNPKPPCVVFNFLYNNNTTQQTELRQELACPWCCLSCRKIYSLLKHMSLCHPRFIFTYMPTSYGSCIDVHVNKLYDGTPTPEIPGECSKLILMQKRKEPVKCSPFTAVLVEKGCVPEEDMTEFLNDGSWKRGINANRQYYHTQSCTPMFPDELQFDSDNDEIPEWQKICSQKMLDEFTDVNRGEKELMKRWNLFAMENRLVADKEISAACIKFATRMKSELIEKHIVCNFMAHLASLFDYGLVTAAAIHQSMGIILGTHNSS